MQSPSRARRPIPTTHTNPVSRQSGRVGLVVALLLLGAVIFFAWRKSNGPGDGADGVITVDELYK